MTSDEKWKCYENVHRKFQWVNSDEVPQPIARPGLHPRKIMLCIWWDSQGIVYYELMSNNTTVTADVYCEQLVQQKRLNQQIIKILHDNATPHVARKS